jgi:alkylhydroperoxidase family enzyme
MPRIRPLEPDDADPQVRALFERLQREQGQVPAMFRTMALRPELAATAEAHLRAVIFTGTVEPRLKEMLAVRVSQVNHCMY